MTKEELKQEAEEYCANNCGDCYGCHKKYRKNKNCEKIKSMIKTYLISAEPREKEIKSLGERCLQLQKDKGELTDKVAELEAQIEKMKCCGNCRFSENDKLNGTFCHREGCFVVASAKCKLWEN